jgi:transcriptional regulator with XRE-family HTH domain
MPPETTARSDTKIIKKANLEFVKMDNGQKDESGQDNFSLKAQFSERFNLLLRSKGLTQAELSRMTAEGASKINEYSKGRILPSALTAIALAEALDVSVPYLMLGRAGVADAAHSVPILDANRALPDGGHDLKLYSAQITLDDHLLRQIGRSTTEGLIMVRAEGDSMAPVITDGAHVLIDRLDRRLREGVFAVRVGEDMRIKRLRPVGVGGVELISDNGIYPPERFEGEMLKAFSLIGRALWAGTKL